MTAATPNEGATKPKVGGLQWPAGLSVAVLGPVIALVLACAFFATQSDRFLSGANFSLILQQVAVVGVIAIGQTLVILTGGIDLSCGMLMALGGIVMTRFATTLGMPPVLAIACGIGVTALFGLVNGLLVTRIRLPSFIVTLGTMNIAFAATQLYSGAQTVTDLPPLMTALGDTFAIGGTQFAWGTVAMLALYALAWFVLRETAAGRHVYAVGNDKEAARLAGVAVDRTLISVYTVAGVICGIAGWAVIGRIGAVSALSGSSANLDSITATVIGGTSLFGGRGSIVGTLVGALIVGVFRNGLALAGADGLWQEFAIGVLIILAVTIDQWIRKVGT